MSNDTAGTLVLVAAGIGAYVLYTRQATAARKKAATAAASKQKTAAVATIGAGVATALGSWLGSSSGQASARNAVSGIASWFSPSQAAAPSMPMDLSTAYGNYNFGDDSTTPAVLSMPTYSASDATLTDWSDTLGL